MKKLLLVSAATALVIAFGFFVPLGAANDYKLALIMFGAMFSAVCVGIEIGIQTQKEKETP